jgi:hypothetical protein
VNVVRFCETCGTQLRPDFPGDGPYLCRACKALAREESGADSPADPGNVVIGYAVWLVAFCVAAGAAWWVAAKILAGAGY